MLIGKVDKKALPLPNLGSLRGNIVPPRNNIDEIIIEELQNILHLDNISIKDSFFGIGGDSLIAITLCTHLEDRLKMPVLVKDIFANPVIEHLSDAISKHQYENTNASILKVEDRVSYPLSCAQKRIYYANAIAGDKSIVYNVCGGLLFDNIISPSKAENALNKLIEIHSSFRTVFLYEDGMLLQKIKKNAKISLEIEHSNLSIEELTNSFPKAFDLAKAPLIRAKLYILEDESSLLLLDTHHIIVDGTSLAIIFRDFCRLYNDELVEKNTFKCADYSVWEENFLASSDIKPYEEFWVDKFKDKDFTALNLPYDYPLSNVKSYNGKKISLKIADDKFESLENLARVKNVSVYSVFLSALYVLLYKYTLQDHIIVGSPFAGRSFPDVQNLVGMFVNNIVLGKSIDDNLTFEEFLKTVHADVLEAISNQPYPYEVLQKNLNLGSNNSLLDVMFTYQNIETKLPEINNSKAKVLTAETQTSKFNLWFEILPDSKIFNLEFNTDLFKLDTAKSILEHYIFILEQILNNSSLKINDFEMVTPLENKLLEKFNTNDIPVNDDTIIDIFEHQVIKTPNNIAAVCDDVSLSYKELNKLANSLAHYLINFGIKPNDIVCIMTNRSLETIVCMLGILKAGGAFFNVDPTYPESRTKYYIEDSKTKYVLTQKELKDKVKTIENCIEIDLSNSKIYDANFENPHVKLKHTDLSYIIYTSGSTGTPKGVMLNQVGFANMAKSMTYALDYLRDRKASCYRICNFYSF